MMTVIEFIFLKRWLSRTEIESGFPKLSHHFSLKRGLGGLVVFEIVLGETRNEDIISELEPIFKPENNNTIRELG